MTSPWSRAGYVDERVVEAADGRVPWSRFEQLVEAAIATSDPVATAEREAAKRPVSSPARPAPPRRMRGFYVRATFPVIARLDATVAHVAAALAALGDTDDVDQRRVKAILILANPAQAVELLAAHHQQHDRPRR